MDWRVMLKFLICLILLHDRKKLRLWQSFTGEMPERNYVKFSMLGSLILWSWVVEASVNFRDSNDQNGSYRQQLQLQLNLVSLEIQSSTEAKNASTINFVKEVELE